MLFNRTPLSADQLLQSVKTRPITRQRLELELGQQGQILRNAQQRVRSQVLIQQLGRLNTGLDGFAGAGGLISSSTWSKSAATIDNAYKRIELELQTLSRVGWNPEPMAYYAFQMHATNPQDNNEAPSRAQYLRALQEALKEGSGPQSEVSANALANRLAGWGLSERAATRVAPSILAVFEHRKAEEANQLWSYLVGTWIWQMKAIVTATNFNLTWIYVPGNIQYIRFYDGIWCDCLFMAENMKPEDNLPVCRYAYFVGVYKDHFRIMFVRKKVDWLVDPGVNLAGYRKPSYDKVQTLFSRYQKIVVNG